MWLGLYRYHSLLDDIRYSAVNSTTHHETPSGPVKSFRTFPRSADRANLGVGSEQPFQYMLNSVLPTQKGEQKAVNKDRQVRSSTGRYTAVGNEIREFERLTPTKTDDGRTDANQNCLLMVPITRSIYVRSPIRLRTRPLVSLEPNTVTHRY